MAHTCAFPCTGTGTGHCRDYEVNGELRKIDVSDSLGTLSRSCTSLRSDVVTNGGEMGWRGERWRTEGMKERTEWMSFYKPRELGRKLLKKASCLPQKTDMTRWKVHQP